MKRTSVESRIQTALWFIAMWPGERTSFLLIHWENRSCIRRETPPASITKYTQSPASMSTRVRLHSCYDVWIHLPSQVDISSVPRALSHLAKNISLTVTFSLSLDNVIKLPLFTLSLLSWDKNTIIFPIWSKALPLSHNLLKFSPSISVSL